MDVTACLRVGKYPKFTEFQAFVSSKHVVNNAAERFIGVAKPRVSKFRDETNLQSNLLTTVKVRKTYSHGVKGGIVKTWRTKAEMNLFKPSDLLVREEDVINDSSDEVFEISEIERR